MQVMGPPKLNTREIFTWVRPTIIFSPSISSLTATDIRSCTVNSQIPPHSVAALQQLGWAKYIYKYDSCVLPSLQQGLKIETDAIPTCETFDTRTPHYNYYIL